MLKRKLLVVAVTGALSSGAIASSFHNQGSVLGYGDAGNNHTLFSNFKNPAYLGGDDTNREVGLGIGLGIDVELKNVDNMNDNFNTMNTSLNALPVNIGSQAAAIDIVNTFFDKNANLNVTTKVSGTVPLVVQTTNYGGYMLGYSRTMGGSFNIIRNGAVTAGAGGTTIADFVDTNAGVDVTAYQMDEFSLSYAADLNRFFKPQNGQVNAGVRLKMMNAGFNRSVVSFDDYLQSSDDLSKKLEDDLKGIDSFSKTESQFGVDLGMQYIAKNYLLGLSVENVNTPKFKYDLKGQAAVGGAFNTLARKEIKFEPKTRVEAATYSQNRRWTFAGFADLTKTMDITGLETQKAGVSASYASNRWFLPDLRVGYTNESAGNKMSRMHGGVTLGFLSVDVAANSFEFGEDKDNSLAANVSVEFTF